MNQTARRYHRILESRRPGQTLADLARENGLQPSTLYSYRCKLKHLDQEQRPALLPVIFEPTPRSEPAPIELVIGPFSIRLPADFDERCLQRLLGVLEESC